MSIIKFFSNLFSSADDPVKHCELYKEQGCAHVDGFLCDLHTCPERAEYNKAAQPQGEQK